MCQVELAGIGNLCGLRMSPETAKAYPCVTIWNHEEMMKQSNRDNNGMISRAPGSYRERFCKET